MTRDLESPSATNITRRGLLYTAAAALAGCNTADRSEECSPAAVPEAIPGEPVGWSRLKLVIANAEEIGNIALESAGLPADAPIEQRWKVIDNAAADAAKKSAAPGVLSDRQLRLVIEAAEVGNNAK